MRVMSDRVRLGLVFLCGAVACGVARAGNLDSPGAPTDPASAMYTLEDLYNRLDIGTAGTPSVFAEPGAGPGSTGHSLDQVMGKAPATNANAAVAAEVLSGKVFWGLALGVWGQQTGSMANRGAVTITPGTTQQTIQQGYHNGAGHVEGDADLVTGNIRSGVNIFGVNGDPNVVNTSSGNASADSIELDRTAWVDGIGLLGTRPVATLAKTGQTTVYRFGDDGMYQTGVVWGGIYHPGPRFTDHGDGTVTDNLTGLMWTKNANIWGAVDWNTAVNNCEGYSLPGYSDWRLPNLRELQSLIDYKNYNPALPSGHPFTNVPLWSCWSATTYADVTTSAWTVYLVGGHTGSDAKTSTFFVWPVRGGQ